MTKRFALYPAGILLLLMGVGAYFRLKNLAFQSLWIDELVTMLTAHPANTTDEMLTFLKKGNDPHPPLYHFLMHAWFQFGGFSDYGARLPSVIAGVAAIPILFALGRELFNSRAGLFAAVFTTFNYYNIFYSQEARGYIFAFVFSAVSYIFFVRLIKTPGWRSGLLYALSTTLLLYTHYYGFIILFAQGVTVFVFLITAKPWKPLMIYFSAAVVLMFLLYLPWFGDMLALAQTTKEFWIQKPGSSFFIDYFKDYFGRDSISSWAFAFLFIAFLMAGLNRREDSSEKDPYVFCFTILFIWIVVSYLVPYVRSHISVPMLFNRYTIVTLPAILVGAAIGLEHFPSRAIKGSFVVFLVIASLIVLFLYKRHYERPVKQQWREMAQFVVSNGPPNTPIISDRRWHQSYYFDAFHVKPRYVTIEELDRLPAVWVTTGQLGQPLTKEDEDLVAFDFEPGAAFAGIDTSARLFVRKKLTLEVTGGKKVGLYRAPSTERPLKTDAVSLPQGKYALHVFGYGDKWEGEPPEVKLGWNGKGWKEFRIGSLENYTFSFEVKEAGPVEFSLSLIHPAMDQASNPAVFIKYMSVEPAEKNITDLMR